MFTVHLIVNKMEEGKTEKWFQQLTGDFIMGSNFCVVLEEKAAVRPPHQALLTGLLVLCEFWGFGEICLQLDPDFR